MTCENNPFKNQTREKCRCKEEELNMNKGGILLVYVERQLSINMRIVTCAFTFSGIYTTAK